MIDKPRKNPLIRRKSLFDRKDESLELELTREQMQQLEAAFAKEVEKMLQKSLGGNTTFTIKLF